LSSDQQKRQKSGVMLRAYSADWTGADGSPIELTRAESHHLSGVRRVRSGEHVEVLNGRGAVALCRVSGMTGKIPQLEVIEVRTLPPPTPSIHLKCALCKGKGFAAVLQKAVELGVQAITPLLTQHVEASATKVVDKGERWEAILIEALKQSGNPWLPRLHAMRPLSDDLQDAPEAVSLCAALQPDAQPLGKLIEPALASPAGIHLYVGPEGDFSPEEYAALRSGGVLFASLGPLVLRVETAASLAIGAIQVMAASRRED
jgi:16S rRNA (uracil1498-N3)-methyltransferase